MSFLLDIKPETVVLFLGSLLFVALLMLWHTNKEVDFDVKSALMREGKFSLSKLGQLVALMTSTWVVIYQTRHGLMTEWLFTGYMLAWSGANLLGRYLDNAKKG